jgi:hypothetical protein
MSGGSGRACIDKGGGSDLPGRTALLEAGAPADELGAGGVEQAIGEGRTAGVGVGGAAARCTDAACLAVGMGLILQLLAALLRMGQHEVVRVV